MPEKTNEKSYGCLVIRTKEPRRIHEAISAQLKGNLQFNIAKIQEKQEKNSTFFFITFKVYLPTETMGQRRVMNMLQIFAKVNTYGTSWKLYKETVTTTKELYEI